MTKKDERTNNIYVPRLRCDITPEQSNKNINQTATPSKYTLSKYLTNVINNVRLDNKMALTYKKHRGYKEHDDIYERLIYEGAMATCTLLTRQKERICDAWRLFVLKMSFIPLLYLH